jgi:hypothetical protein
MKTMKILFLVLVTISIACISCSKDEDQYNEGLQKKSTGIPDPIPVNLYEKIWTENFDSPFTLSDNWRLWGDRNSLPQWVESAYGRQGLFDNKGPSPIKNYAMSNSKFGKGLGYSVESELMLKILNPNGTCVCPGIAVSKNSSNQIEPAPVDETVATGISMRIVYAGSHATWYPLKLRQHTWLYMEFLTENGTLLSSGYLPADMYANDWHKLKIVVTSTRYVKFYCDNTLIWAPFNHLHSSMIADKYVVLGYTSDGNSENRAGVAYHNWVRAFWTVKPEIE